MASLKPFLVRGTLSIDSFSWFHERPIGKAGIPPSAYFAARSRTSCAPMASCWVVPTESGVLTVGAPTS